MSAVSRSCCIRTASRRRRGSSPPSASTTPRCTHGRELDPDAFWAEQARELHWDKPFTTVLDDSNPPFYKWFTDGKLNVSYNCVDRHVEAGHGNRVAFHWAGEEGEQRAITYAELHRDVQRLANALKGLGVGKGDIVGIYLPMIPEVIVSMLACARIGAPHNVVFGGFAPEAVRERMEVSDAKVLITVDGARRKGKTAPVKAAVDAVLGDLESLEHIVVVRHTGIDTPMTAGRDVFYDEIVAAADPFCPAEPMEAEHPLFILYTSGSTAKPKGIVHTTGGYLTGVSSTHRYVFDLDPERDVFFCSADVGWVTGHSYIVYGPLANGATSVMYEGAPDYPDKGIWWELVERYGVTIFYTAPTAIRACMKWGAEHPNAHDLSSLRLLGTVGEPINPKAWLWYHVVIGRERCPIVDTWWQTETGQIMISPLPGLTETKPGSATFPLPGVLADVVDETTGKSIEQGQGLLVLTRPWPGMLRTLFGKFNKARQDRWVFADRTSGAFMHKFAWTNIVRHQTVRQRASPDDPALAEYWARRQHKLPLPINHTAMWLYRVQDGCCAICESTLTAVEDRPQTPREWEHWLATTRKTIDIVWDHGTSDKAEPRLIHLRCRHGRGPAFLPAQPPAGLARAGCRETGKSGS